ncbi:polysaccharide pyruvyl transferase family protein [Carnobacterium maltaromaticum]|uniref:Polysaccharide pyruvyl transferase family protein n=1 Tax=Carnobacterium maltaromaticum TaxID=2751 RepID=A0AAW9K6C7_CARML|nr:polysaccharide pyruvyl transferase family protein [Carnobacterium maltaromaticum]MDZ5759252.1 polysaccharide pyruvyl transferase family protein [Carnobacterium maltaromaticum]
MKIMIEHGVPLNTGDAALIFALGDELENCGHEVIYSTFNLKKVKMKYPERKWKASVLSHRMLNRIPFLSSLYYYLCILFSKTARQQDLIISAPGGYINSYYGFEAKLKILSLYKKLLGKKLIMFSQSIGPLSKKDEEVLKKYIPYFTEFLVRDEPSYERMEKLGLAASVLQTYDAAFLRKPLEYNPKIKNKKIAVSVRTWDFANRSQSVYRLLIQRIVTQVVQAGFEVVFLSTCQGEETYVDDSKEALLIYQQLPDSIQKYVEIDNNNYTLEELVQELTSYSFVIGTRLHMCILAWLAGTPAFNISYEEKGLECYRYLKMLDYTIDFNETENFEIKLAQFLQMSSLELENCFKEVEGVHDSMKKKLQQVLKIAAFSE